MFFSKNKKNNVYPYKPQFYYIKVGFNGVKISKYIDSEGPDRTARFNKLIWAFAVRMCPKTRFAWYGPNELFVCKTI